MHPGPTKAARRVALLLRRAVPVLGAALVAVAAVTASPATAAAAGPKVVIVVGPTSSSTSLYLSRAESYAAEARSLGASVVEVFTPHATWSRVETAIQGAKVVMYLGHGNGWPSPYTSSIQTTTQDGFGLNPVDGVGLTSPVGYVGEKAIAADVRLAPGAIVLLNHLCYASGNAEPGMATPTWAVARERVDNYAAGFISAGAQAVVADAHDISYELKLSLSTGVNFLSAWRTSPYAQGHLHALASTRHPGWTNYLDPDDANAGFYRALTTRPTFVTGTPIAAVPLTATARTTAIVRSQPSTSATRVTSVATGATVRITAALRSDSVGRTWAPVRTATGQTGWIAAWLLNFRGSAVPVTTLILRSQPSTTSTDLLSVGAGVRVAVTGSTADSHLREWFAVRTSTGRTGWMAAWLMKP